jgi:hypothetical protein
MKEGPAGKFPAPKQRWRALHGHAAWRVEQAKLHLSAEKGLAVVKVAFVGVPLVTPACANIHTDFSLSLYIFGACVVENMYVACGEYFFSLVLITFEEQTSKKLAMDYKCIH